MSAQIDPKTNAPQPVSPRQPDSLSSNRQLEKQSDMKTMDAVKTQDHVKVTTKKGKDATKKRARKDTLKSTKVTRSNP